MATVALGFAACGGDDDDDDDGGGEPSATVASSETAEPRETTEPDSTRTPRATSTARSGDGVPSPLDLDSYRFEVDIEIGDPATPDETLIRGSVSGEFEGPDKHYILNEFEVAGISGRNETILIGDQAWYRDEGEEWAETTLTDSDVESAIQLSSADPEGFFAPDDEFLDDISQLQGESESHNGLDTTKYTITNEDFELLTRLLGEEFLSPDEMEGIESLEMTVWVAEEGDYVVGTEITIVGDATALGEDVPAPTAGESTIRIRIAYEITDIDDSSIKVEPPI